MKTARAVGWAWVVLLPLGQVVVVPVAGVSATLTDAVLVIFLLAGGVALATERGGSKGMGEVPAPHLARAAADRRTAWILLGGYAGWVALSGLYGAHGGYALAKGAGLGALCAGAWLMSRLERPRRIADAFVLGAVVAVIFGLLAWIAGPASLRGRVLFAGGTVSGLPVQRLMGPLAHPNLLGELLAVAGLLLWARWPAWASRSSAGARASAVLIAGGLLLTVSSAWVAAGVGTVGLACMHGGRPTGRRLALGAAGGALALLTLAGLVAPLEFALAGTTVSTTPTRPDIWASAWGAFASHPLIGVGAAPYLAETVVPGSPGPNLWDAHSTWLSVPGQFGLVGAALLFGGIALLARDAWRIGGAQAPPSRRLAVGSLAALAGVSVHWVAIAGEDFRHLWVLLALLAAVGVPRATHPVPGEPEAP